MNQKKSAAPLPAPLFRLAFRPFFLFGALFSALCLGTWSLALNNGIQLNPYGGALFWHSHEMLFGFTCAIIVGFLLTAVQNWTGIPSIKGKTLAFLFFLWLAARIGALFSWPQPWLYVLLDISFLPLAALFLAKPIVAIRQYRNLFFVPVLVLLTIANTLMHSSVIADHQQGLTHGAYMAVWLIVFIMSVLGGRVIPMFTANGTKTQKALPLPWLENMTLGSTLLLTLVYSSNLQNTLPNYLLGTLYLIAALSHGVRFVRWRFWVTVRTPLVWSLHSAYCFIPLGLLVSGLSIVGAIQTSPTTLLHFFTAGAMGALIIAMMSRVSLGHSGRPLQPHPLMTFGFISIFMSGLIRTLGIVLLPSLYSVLINLSAALWVFSFILFVVLYFNILSKPRLDGGSG